MKTAIATHEPRPKGPHLESLSIGRERARIRVASVARRCICPLSATRAYGAGKLIMAGA